MKSMQHFLIRCCELGSKVETRSTKCKENIVKKMKVVMSHVLLLVHSHGMNISSGTTKMNGAISDIDLGCLDASTSNGKLR